MSTYGTIQDNIAAMISRSDLTSSIQREIINAVADYSHEAFDWNEDSFTRTLTSTSKYYTLTGSMSLITQIVNVIANDSGGSWELKRRTPQELDAIDSTSGTGQPSYYSIWQNILRVYPQPSTTYTLTVRAIRRYVTLSATSDSNAWTINAQLLIEARAAWRLASTKMRNPNLAQSFRQIEIEEYNRLKAASALKTMSLNLNPTSF